MFLKAHRNMALLRSLVRESLIREFFQSYTLEPAVGDMVLNNNPGCKHYGSMGVVLSISHLPSDIGKKVEYECLNRGPEWSRGDVLTKTLDQLIAVE